MNYWEKLGYFMFGAISTVLLITGFTVWFTMSFVNNLEEVTFPTHVLVNNISIMDELESIHDEYNCTGSLYYWRHSNIDGLRLWCNSGTCIDGGYCKYEDVWIK